MKLIYSDSKVVVCIKPAGVRSTDEPGQLPDLVRQALGDPNAIVRTVHRLDQVVSGLMVLARSAHSASDLSLQIQNHTFAKEYLAVIHGCPQESNGVFEDLLKRDKSLRKSFIVDQPGKDVQTALLHYQVINSTGDLSRVKVQLHTGRTHQIRVQFSSRGYPLVGDGKYGTADAPCPIALWSHRIGFFHPKTGEFMEFKADPPDCYPWNIV